MPVFWQKQTPQQPSKPWLVKAGYLDEANKEAAASAMEDAQWAEADDDPKGFDEDLAGAGIL
jgi:hypothetical protein